MNSVSNQIFRINSSFIRETKICAFLFLIAAAVFFWIPFLPGENSVKFLITIGIFVPFLVSSGFYGFYIVVKQIPFSAVEIDKDGIWYEHLKKEEGLIPWESIKDLKEVPVLGRLILIDREGIPLMKIEYQLSNFDSLRLILADKIQTDSDGYENQ